MSARFGVAAAALALTLVLTAGGRADAQVITYPSYGLGTFYSPYSGMYSRGSTFYGPGMVQSSSSYYSPWTGAAGQQYYYGNASGTRYYQGYGYNPYSGFSYNRGTWPGQWRANSGVGYGMRYYPRSGCGRW